MTEIRVILIDDDKTARESLAQHLELLDFIVDEFGDGEEALEHIAKSTHKFTAVLLDYVLSPPMSGEDFLNIIAKNHPRLPVIVFTGLDPEGGVESLSKGAYRYLRRPLDRRKLVSIITDIAEQDDVFRKMAEDVRHMLKSDMCLAWRLERRKRQFQIIAWDGRSDLDEEFRKTVFIDIDVPATEKLLNKRYPIFLKDVKNPKLAPHYQHRKEAEKLGWTSLFSIPVVRHDRVIGLVDSYTFKPFEFTDEFDRNQWLKVILPSFSHQAAEAIRNGELSSQFQAIQGLNEVLAGTFEETTILNLILTKALELVGTEIGWLYRVDVNKNKLVLKEGIGIAEELIGFERNFGEGISGCVAKEGVALYVPNLLEDSRHKPVSNFNLKSGISVPLRREEQTIGVLTVMSNHINAFTGDDVSLLASLSTQAAVVIDRTEVTNYSQKMGRLALSGDYHQLAKYVVESVRNMTGADVILWEMNDEENEKDRFLKVKSFKGNLKQTYIDGAIIPITPNSSITASALISGKPKIIYDFQNVTENIGEPEFYNKSGIEQHGWRSFMCVPLLGQDKLPIGSLSLYSKEARKFGDADSNLMQVFANYISVAIESHLRREQLKQLKDELEMLQGIVHDISTSGIEVDNFITGYRDHGKSP